MAKLLIQDFRDLWDYRKEFDVVLGTPFNVRSSNYSKFIFYNKLGKEIEDLGKRVFIPYRDINPEWSRKKVRDIVSKIVVPLSELVLVDAKAPQYVYDLIVTKADKLEIPLTLYFRNFSSEGVRKLIHLAKKYNKNELQEAEVKLQEEWKAIKELVGGVVELKDDVTGLKGMVSLVKWFYGIK